MISGMYCRRQFTYKKYLREGEKIKGGFIMRKKLLAALLATAMVATLLAGCGAKEEAPAETPAEETEAPAEAPAEEGAMHFEIVSKGLQHQYWQAVKKGVEQKAAELGVTVNFVGPDSESNIDQQVTQLENAMNSNPTAIGLAALDTSAVLDHLQQAKDAGIPVVGFDSGVPNAPEGSVLANCSTDNLAAGALAAEEVYAAVKERIAAAAGSVRVGVVAQDATSESVVNRGLGFIDKFGELAEADGYTVGLSAESNDRYVTDSKYDKDEAAKVIIEVRVPASVDSQLSTNDATAIMSKEDTIAIYGSNEHSANAIISANDNMGVCGSGEGQIIAAGFDSGKNQIAAVKAGTLYGSITQAPVAMGEVLVQTLYDAATGKDVADTDTGCQWYTAENADNAEIAQNLYE